MTSKAYQIIDDEHRMLMVVMAHDESDALEQYDAIQWAASGVWFGTDGLTAERSEDDDD